MNEITNIKKLENYLINNFEKIKINSNDLSIGDVFVALQGKNNHGNIYIKDSIETKGAKFVITEKKYDKLNNRKQNERIICVDDVFKFLQDIAEKKRNLYKGTIIGITGSSGKTSVKEALKFFLSSEFIISASIKSYNNYLGVLISLLNLNLSSKFAIFEIGTNNFNEIKILTKIIQPSQVIITNIHSTHLENFINTRNIAIEKSDIFNPKINNKIKVVISKNSNSDESFIKKIAQRYKIESIITLGNNNKETYNLINIESLDDGYYLINLKENNKNLSIKLNTNIDFRIHNLIFCLIIFKYNKIKLDNFFYKLNDLLPVMGRGLKTNIKFNNHNLLLIDESYNASPFTMLQSIVYFSEIKSHFQHEKILILGDMNELGKNSIDFHIKILNELLTYSFKKVIICGELFNTAIKKTSNNSKLIIYMRNKTEILDYLKLNINNNDLLLIKCSNSTEVNSFAKDLINKKG